MRMILNKRNFQPNPIVKSRPRKDWEQNIKEVLKKHQNKKDEGVIHEFLDEELNSLN